MSFFLTKHSSTADGGGDDEDVESTKTEGHD
ncbi:uncharacterized protein G2W53_035472 [Senna tora]|uniref:Uncharacterized protein n=1 Tax=Senna tora TaxID=362788 RepID=A0A834W997_9FABA|nr:uncharacterized protein G2W53_035472 [Senna tora]